ncbi:hypothetical protein [Nocardia sp. NPDC051750]|uniref:hypothetical protein n=1 Tax=Nocardia sp. NPDC051750 TaxID=3364325 RepID=UPI0037AD03FF
MPSVSAVRRSSTPWWVLAAIAVPLLVLAGAVGVFVDTQMVRTATVYTSTQPDAVDYDGFTYHAGLVRRESRLLGRRLDDKIMISRDPGLTYGHPVYFEILGNRDPVPTTVQWRPDGVSVRFDSGHEIFVPAAAFTGGR